MIVPAVERLGRNASVGRIVQTMATFFSESVAYVLLSAAKCLLSSDAIAHEAFRQLMRSSMDKRRSVPHPAIRAYRDGIAVADELITRAVTASRSGA